ncbi:thiamine pyrophosphate-binding protein [Ottowia sp.]|uniref:thiamine pyrophosphate-binding protein n=1 Tax=Ottowia sp. TaxID=1898956 RepID=UPI0025FBDBBC|nr:thiamine pyrophosphate-binding protein [Ottowia sp.]MBK6613705.1 hypothetical protein [Ottowia sp.]
MNNEIDNTGAQFMARALGQHGVRRVFGLCGDHINALYRALTLEDIEDRQHAQRVGGRPYG